MTANLLILRDPRESWRKCSLAPLRGANGIRFVSYHLGLELDAEGRTLLDPEAPPLGPADQGRPLLLLDSSWRRLPKLRACLRGRFVPRSVPPFVTAYPRRSTTFADPVQGLASIEALFVAACALGRPELDWLRGYRFAREFLRLNPGLPGGPFELPPAEAAAT
jgi:pre-rRNA-processing protein TSR3